MINWRVPLLLLLISVPPASATAAEGRIAKVLPHYLDLQRRHTLSPSLYERDAYQAFLRQNPANRSSLRFDVHWKARSRQSSAWTLRVEVRGSRTDPADPVVLEQPLRARLFSQWTSVLLEGADFERFGELVAWRATLWSGPDLIAEERSFLW